MHLHCHERFDINNYEQLGFIWEHRKEKEKGEGEIFLSLEGYYSCRIKNNLHIGSNKHKSIFFKLVLLTFCQTRKFQ